MKKFKRIFLAIFTLALGLTLASCKGNDARNTKVPYGTLANETSIATANNGAYSLTAKTYYDRLRTKSYDTFVRELKYELYKNEIQAITNLLENKLTNEDKATLAYTNKAEDADIEYLYEKYDTLLGNSLATAIYGTYSLSTFNAKSDADKELAELKYEKTQLRKGYTVNKDSIKVTTNEELGTISVSYKELDSKLVKEFILSQAQILQAEKALYAIAGEKEIPSVDEDGNEVMVKNSYNLFTEAKYKSTYESSIMNYGTYKAVIIQFNSYKEAQNAISKVSASIDNPDAFYLELYNSQYSYKQATSLDDAGFTYEVNEKINELSKISAGVSTLVTDTLNVDNKEDSYLKEPRNINNKYVMAYVISADEHVEYDDLTEAQKAEYKSTLERLIIENNASAYATTALNKLIENSEIKIYDPFLEYKFEYSYSTQYDTIEATENNDILFSVGSTEYKVDDFYNLMSSTIGQTVILEYFSLEYATQFVDEYVSEETQKTNKETLKTNIKAFKDNENTTYPAEIGLETFLLANYGYNNEDDVMKYFYNAASALASYKNDIVNESWIKNDSENKLNVMSDSAAAVINKLLTSGKEYNDIFSIDIDHILINIDDNGDGNPDDPRLFLKDYENVSVDFKTSVEKLAQAIYTEAAWLVEKGNTTFEAFQYIVKQYNKGEALHSIEGANWDQYKTYNFLLTAEQLASSSDITQDSVSNFVVPFKEYVENVVTLFDKDVEFENGQVVVVNDKTPSKVEKATDITYDNLCLTNYGYHLLVVNEYTEPESLKSSSTSDKYNSHFIKISSGDDEKSEDDDVYVSVNTLNTNETKATTEQLYVYLVQKELGITSTLDSDIAAILGSLYDEAISTFTSTNFQTLVLIDKLSMKSDNQAINTLISNERAYYTYLVTNYDSESVYNDWCNVEVTTSIFKK